MTISPPRQESVTDAVKVAYRAGLCVVPPRQDGSKRPVGSWEQWERERPSREQMQEWYGQGSRDGLGIVCGTVSGNVELFEFDDVVTYQPYKDTAESMGYGELVERIEAGYLERTPGGGYHWFYRCETISGNTALAKRPGHEPGTVDVLIETRGEGGYAVLAPSAGRVHPKGTAYQRLRGSLDTIATITPAEREALFHLARAFDEMPKLEYRAPASVSAPAGGRPGDDYDARASWPDILRPHGWELVAHHGRTEYWRRPGDTDNRWSATINGAGVGPNRLYVFSSSTVFDADRSYTPFQAYTFLNHAKDYAAAARALRKDGYGAATKTARLRVGAAAPTNGHHEPAAAEPESLLPETITYDDLYAYMPEHKYIFIPTRELWPAASINSRIAPEATGQLKENGKPEYKPASWWLDRERPVEQMTWAPGLDMVIADRLLADGGWVQRAGCATFNLYRPPVVTAGDPQQAGPWVEHVHLLYPSEAEHLIAWLAHRVQHPGQKINHAIVLGGQQGIGKDTLLDPVRHAVGPWNVSEVSPVQLIGRFNSFVRSVILRVSEARDLGDVDRYAFYEHLKVYTAAPPDVLRCDEKNIREYSVLNVCGVVITTNHKTDGIYLPADDRRHFVAWSDLTMIDFAPGYWDEMYAWLEGGGYGHVAAYLSNVDLSDFNPKAPPPKTAAFWDIVDANRSPEDAELADALDQLGNPDATTIDLVSYRADDGLVTWLRDRKNRRQVPHRMEAVGYLPVRNDAAADGLWKITGRRQVVYARRDLTPKERFAAAQALTGR